MGRYRLAACLLAAGLITASTVGAQSGTPSVKVETGLMTGLADHEWILTVTELGPRGVTSRVRLAILNESDVVVARNEGVLSRGFPVQVSFRVPPGVNRPLLRASATIIGDPDGSKVVVGLEDINVNNSFVDRLLCGPGSPKFDPVFICPGWEPTHFVTPN